MPSLVQSWLPSYSSEPGSQMQHGIPFATKNSWNMSNSLSVGRPAQSTMAIDGDPPRPHSAKAWSMHSS